MPVSAEVLKNLIEDELATVSDARVITLIRSALIEPHMVLCSWDYGEPGQQYPCWMVFKDAHSGGEIAYCEHGFGPGSPWGLLSFQPESEQRHIGMDSGWFNTFLDAFFDSRACCALPIWKVFRADPDGTRVALTDEGTWETTWSTIDDLRECEPTRRYDCSHSVKYGR